MIMKTISADSNAVGALAMAGRSDVGMASPPSACELCRFLVDYSARLLGCGSTCLRLEENIRRIAKAYDHQVEVTIMPRHIHLSIQGEDGRTVTAISSVKGGISFNVNTRLSNLSWAIADGKVDFPTACRRLHEIVARDRHNKWLELLLVSLANASFCRLFGGDAAAMAVVGLATMAGYYLKTLMLSYKIDIRVVVIVCSFVSTVLGATDVLFSIGNTPLIAVGSSVLYLVPGIPFLNSFSDLLNRHYICAFSRFVDASVLTCCLSIGLCGGMMLMNVGMF